MHPKFCTFMKNIDQHMDLLSTPPNSIRSNFPMRLGIIVDPDTYDMALPTNFFPMFFSSKHLSRRRIPCGIYFTSFPPYVETKRNPRTTQQIFLSFGERWMNVFQCSFSGFRVKLRCSISFPDLPLPPQCPDKISHNRISYCFHPYSYSLTITLECSLHYKYSVKSLVVLIGISLHS